MISTHYCSQSMFGLEYVQKDGIWYFFDFDNTWFKSTMDGSTLRPIEDKPGGQEMVAGCDNFAGGLDDEA